MANPNSPYGFQWKKNEVAGACITRRFKTLSNTTLSIGDPVISTGGYLKLAGVTSTALFGVCIEAVTGVAATRKSVLIIPAIKTYVWSAQTKTTTVISQGNMNKPFGIQGTTTGKLGLNPGNTTSTCRIIGLLPTSAFGTYAELLFKIAKTSYEGTLS
jgi:hypothetical protein